MDLFLENYLVHLRSDAIMRSGLRISHPHNHMSWEIAYIDRKQL